MRDPPAGQSSGPCESRMVPGLFFEMFRLHVFPMRHTLATSTAKQKSRTNCLRVSLSTFTRMFYLPPSPEGNLGFWDQKQDNRRNSPRKTMKAFLFPGRLHPNRAGCMLQPPPAPLALTRSTCILSACQ